MGTLYQLNMKRFALICCILSIMCTLQQIKFCVLLACFFHVESGKEFCLVRHLQEQTDPVGEPILNEFECPLLLLTSCLYLVSTTCIVSPISIVHSCDSMCKFVECITNRVTERELVPLKKLTFCHNLLNNMYCYNIFCISNNTIF